MDKLRPGLTSYYANSWHSCSTFWHFISFFSPKQKYIFKMPKLFFVPVLNTSHCNRTQLFIVPQFFSSYILKYFIEFFGPGSYCPFCHAIPKLHPYSSNYYFQRFARSIGLNTRLFTSWELIRVVSICVFFQKKTASKMIWKTFRLTEFVFRLFIKFKIPV